MSRPVIIVHGGAWAIPDSLCAAHREGCRRAAKVGLRLLRSGHSAEDAVEEAVRHMEDNETFDAGRGSFLNRDGLVELDAAFMEGSHLNVGAVAAVRDIANVVSLARLVMNSEHVFIVGDGATRFATDHGMSRCDPERLVISRELEAWRAYREQQGPSDPWGHSDTVGAIALDASGHLAAAVSTGGRPFKYPGRVGDVPCVGAGFYADDTLGAAVSTGEGEAILRVVMAKRAVDGLASGETRQVATDTIDHLYRRLGGHARLIMLDPEGNASCSFNTSRMARAWSRDGVVLAAVDAEC